MKEFLDFISIEPSTMIIAVLNLLILYFILKRFLFGRVDDIIQKREKELSELYENADSAVNEGNALKQNYERKIDGVLHEKKVIISEASAEANMKAEAILKSSLENVARIKKDAEKELSIKQQEMISEVKEEVAGISISIAEKILEREIDEEKHKDIIEQFISDLGHKDE